MTFGEFVTHPVAIAGLCVIFICLVLEGIAKKIFGK